jgi:hypothetical protein
MALLAIPAVLATGATMLLIHLRQGTKLTAKTTP